MGRGGYNKTTVPVESKPPLSDPHALPEQLDMRGRCG